MKKELNVLSLFDGISCGYVALERAGFKVNKYYASEISECANEVSDLNHPDIVRLGDIRGYENWDINWSKIDLLIGGSPCTNLSRAGNREGLEGDESCLFYYYIHVLNKLKEANPNIKFLLENTIMSDKWRIIISDILNTDPVQINSCMYSAQQRTRLYWFNWYYSPLAMSDAPDFQDIVESGLVDIKKAYCLTHLIGNCRDHFKKHNTNLVFEPYNKISMPLYKVCDSDIRTPKIVYQHIIRMTMAKSKDPQKIWLFPTSLPDGVYIARPLTVTEIERLQTLPEGYLRGLSLSQAQNVAGLGWTVNVIAEILKQME